MRHANAFIFASLALTAPTSAQTQSDATKSHSVQGSFQPPLNDPTNESTDVFGTGMLVLADPVSLYGVVVGAGFGFGDAERPRWGIEAGAVLLRGGGEIAREGYGTMDMSTHVFGGSAVMKYRTLDPADTGWLGLTLYGGPNLGFFQFGTTNDAGTAWRTGVQLGALGGVLGQALITDRVEVMLFVGGRASVTAFVPEDGDPVAFDPVAIMTPDFGGNITAHLPAGFDLSLGSMVNFFRGDDDEKGTARTFILGLSWSPQSGVAPIVDTATPEVTP